MTLNAWFAWHSLNKNNNIDKYVYLWRNLHANMIIMLRINSHFVRKGRNTRSPFSDVMSIVCLTQRIQLLASCSTRRVFMFWRCWKVFMALTTHRIALGQWQKVNFNEERKNVRDWDETGDKTSCNSYFTRIIILWQSSYRTVVFISSYKTAWMPFK